MPHISNTKPDDKRPGEHKALARWRAFCDLPEVDEDSRHTGETGFEQGSGGQWTQAEFGMTVDGVYLEGSFPQTAAIIDFRLDSAPNRRFEWARPLWRVEEFDLAEPSPFDRFTQGIVLRERLAAVLHRLNRMPERTITRIGGLGPLLSQAEILEGIERGEIDLRRRRTMLVTRPDDRS